MGSLTATATARNLRLGFCASGVAWPVFTDRNGCGYGNVRKRICTFHCSLYTFPSCRHKTISSSSSSLCKLSVANSAPGVASSEELKESVSASSEQTIQVGSATRTSLNSLMEVVAEDLQMLNDNLRSVVGAGNPMLISAADQIFSAGGKRMRPALVFLVSRATATMAGLKDLTPEHRRLAEIIEMIHTASLIHDDVLDESEVRRGRKTIHQLYGTRVAVLAGDFLFAQSSWYLANLENLEVIKLISQVIKDFASGEIKQASNLFDCNMSMEDYMEKSFYKTASLVAASTRSAAIFSGVSREVCEAMYEYGRNLGLAFQVVDDILDLTQSTTQLGKPAGSDLAKGNLTAPVLYALRPQKKKKEEKEDEDEDAQELRHIIESEFLEEGSLERAVQLVQCGQGIRLARILAQRCAGEALRSLCMLPPSPAATSLRDLVHYVLYRVN